MSFLRKASSVSLFLLLPTASLSFAQQASPSSVRTHDVVSTGDWVTTWATAQQLIATPPYPGEAHDREKYHLPPDINDETVRMTLQTSISGGRLRLKLSNAAGDNPVFIQAVHIAKKGAKAGSIVADTDHAATFDGSSSVIIPPGVILFSDPIDFDVAPQTDLSVSLYLPKATGVPTNHLLGLHSTFVVKGNVTAQAELPPSLIPTSAYLWLAGVDVVATPQSFAVVALGDSITDGYGTTINTNNAWPTLLAKKISSSNPASSIAVLNEGISGNQVLKDGAGVSALARFDRDVLSHSGVKWMVLLEGINDINLHTKVTPGIPTSSDDLQEEDVIAGYKQLILRAHAHGISVMGATLTPEEGVPIMSVRGDAMRNAINQWIRTTDMLDGVVDFDRAVRDEAHPARIRKEFDGGDHIHPNDAGNQAMADAFDMTIFLKSAGSMSRQTSGELR